MLINEPELHREADPKMSAAFFRMSRSIRSRSFSRRNPAFSPPRSTSARAGGGSRGEGPPARPSTAPPPPPTPPPRQPRLFHPQLGGHPAAGQTAARHPINRLSLECLRKYPTRCAHPTPSSSRLLKKACRF